MIVGNARIEVIRKVPANKMKIEFIGVKLFELVKTTVRAEIDKSSQLRLVESD
jgi:hypothetical protein